MLSIAQSLANFKFNLRRGITMSSIVPKVIYEINVTFIKFMIHVYLSQTVRKRHQQINS